jgi:hypothetical protein
MRSAKSTGRIVGILLLFQLAAGLMLPFILISPLVAGAPAFLTSGAEHSFQIRAATFIAFAGAALTLSLGITTFPVFRRYGKATALAFLAVCIISAALDAVHSASVMSMLSLSQKYVTVSGAESGMYEAVGVAVAAARRWAHAVQLVAIGAWIFVFYSSLFRFALIPRALAALGMVGIALQFTGVTLMMLTGSSVIGELAMPMLPIQIIVAVWLIVKGFNERKDETTRITRRNTGSEENLSTDEHR